MNGSCTECGSYSLPIATPIGRGVLCPECAIHVKWRLAEAKQLADLVGLTLEELRVAVGE